MAEKVKSGQALNIRGISGEKISPKSLKKGDVLLVFWADPLKHKTVASVVRFERLQEGTEPDLITGVLLNRAKFESRNVLCYCPSEDIVNMQFLAGGSSASAIMF